MIILTIGSDRNLFRPSRARERIKGYGGIFERLLIVVFTRRGFQVSPISSNITAYPTNSRSRWLYPWDAYRAGRKIVGTLSLEERSRLVISAQDPFESGLAAYWLARRYHLPLQIQIHTDFLSPWFRRHAWLNRIRLVIANRIIPQASCFRVVSQRIKTSLEKEFRIAPDRIAALPIRSEPEPFVRREPHEGFRALFLGRLEEEKNPGLALRAFARFVELGGRGRLTMAGTGRLEAGLWREARRLRIQDSVSFVGWSSSPASLFDTHDIFLMTSNYEGWGMAAFEAMLRGLPVIMTDVGLAGEVIRDKRNGIVVPVGDAEALASACFLLARDIEARRKLSQAGQRAAQERLHERGEYLTAYRKSFDLCRK